MTIFTTVNMWHKTTKIKALLDCGATYSFIDPWTIKSLSMGTHPLPHPLIIKNVDGTINWDGTITHYCNLWVCQGNQTEKLGFYMANLGWDQIILGNPWFWLYNPDFDWSTNTLKVLRYCRNVRPTWVKFNSKDTKESEWCSRFWVLSPKRGLR